MTEERAIRCDEVIPTLCVGDVDEAIRYYVEKLGFRELWRWGEPTGHAAVAFDEVVIHLSGSEPDPGGSWLYFVVDDVDRLHQRYIAAGVDVEHAPEDQPWDMREMPLRDLVGNSLCFAAPCITREPKIPVVREEVSVRLEERIVRVLHDLAQHKGFDVGELLEETLLHTFEPYEGGVASPHTPSQLRHIQDLKEKHGLDYGVHGSYRFAEDAEDAEDPEDVKDPAE